MNSSIVRYFTKGTSVTRSPVITKTGWLKCQWCGASPPPDDSPLLGKSRTNMGDLNLLTQLSTCFVLFCDWRIGTLQFSLHTLCSWFLLQLEVINISEYLTTQTPLPPFLPYPRFLLELDLSQTAKMTYPFPLLAKSFVICSRVPHLATFQKDSAFQKSTFLFRFVRDDTLNMNT